MEIDAHGMGIVTSDNANDVAEVSAALHDLLARGVRLRSFRLLQVVCDHQREMLSVVRVSGRVVALHMTSVEYDDDRGGVKRRVLPMFSILTDAEPGAWLTAANRCCSGRITADQITAALESGSRRVPWRESRSPL